MALAAVTAVCPLQASAPSAVSKHSTRRSKRAQRSALSWRANSFTSASGTSQLRRSPSLTCNKRRITATLAASASDAVPAAAPASSSGTGSDKKKVVVIGAGWAGLGAASHLLTQGYDVTLLEAGKQPGGLVAGWRSDSGRSVEVGIHGFWYPYNNIFSKVRELGLSPFTDWTRSAQYSPAGLEVESPIFQDLPRLPSPMGTFVWTQFKRLPLSDRLSALPLMHAVIDFDNSPEAWAQYDRITARELFARYGCTERLYNEAFNPMLLVGLFAPGEQCSAAAALGMLYYFILAHQADFDVVWCRGTVGAQIFAPWLEAMQEQGLKFLAGRRVSGFREANGEVTHVVCDGSGEEFEADAVVSAVGITGFKNIVRNSAILSQRNEFNTISNLGAVDVLAVRLWLDRRISIPKPSNACFGFDETTGWTFFDLNALHDEFRNEPGTVVEVDFYHANQFLPMTDDAIVAKVMSYLATCISAFGQAQVLDRAVIRCPQAVTHFFPGSHQHMPRATTSIPNFFMAGDWIFNQHGSWSQEKAYVTGLEAANLIVSKLGQGSKANIIPIEPDEEHVTTLRTINKQAKSFLASLPLPGIGPLLS